MQSVMKKLITVETASTEEEKLTPPAQCSLLVEHNLTVITQQRLMQTVNFCCRAKAFIFMTFYD